MASKNVIRAFLLLIVVASLGAFGFQRLGHKAAAATESADKPTPSKAVVTKAYYLHNTFRCETCQSIEEQARRTIEEDFAKEIKAGTLVFASLNVDDKPYEHYLDDFKLTSASLVLTDDRGPYGHWKMLPRTWDLVHDPAAFRDYVFKETQAYLAEIK